MATSAIPTAYNALKNACEICSEPMDRDSHNR